MMAESGKVAKNVQKPAIVDEKEVRKTDYLKIMF